LLVAGLRRVGHAHPLAGLERREWRAGGDGDARGRERRGAGAFAVGAEHVGNLRGERGRHERIVLRVARLVREAALHAGAHHHEIIGLPVAGELLAFGGGERVLEILARDTAVVKVARGGNDTEARLRLDAYYLTI
jgi:hypothetical protein